MFCRTLGYSSDSTTRFRSDLHWKMVFREAGLSLLREQVQIGLPRGLFTVKM